MTFIIAATLSAAAVYFVFALVATMRDRLMSRFSNGNNCFQKPEPTPESNYSYMNNLPVAEPVAIAPITSTKSPELPNSIRSLRDYIRENQLQAVVKERIGKTVSKCTKDELMAMMVPSV